MKRKKRTRPRPTRAVETMASDNDPIERLIEWQEHRYDPGYYTGGNFHPLYTASRPNKYGYFLIVGATMILVLLALSIGAGAIDWYPATVLGALMLFMFVVGFKLIQKQPPQERAARRRGRSSKLDD